MDRGELIHRAVDILKKYRWALLILLLGVALMQLPSASADTAAQRQETETEKVGMEEKLAHILSQIQGAGEVQVLLTESTGEQTIYQMDVDESSGSTQTNRKETVIISGGDRSEKGLIQQVIPPKYLGAIVVCHGANDAAVRLALVEAVSKATGLGADRISVLKMK